MADLPRYQSLGVQVADLPKISTAPQQVMAQGFDNLSRNLDRMFSYAEEAATTQAKKEALKYAVENPLTKDVVDRALKSGQSLNVEGGGRVFQETYQKAQGTMLSSELQLEGQRKLSNVAAMIDAGAPVDLNQIQRDLKDMIDGYSTSVMALDPEQSIRLRAALTTTGNALYTKAAERAVKVQQEKYDAQLNQAVEQSKPLIETLISQKAGKIDPSTGKPYDIESILEIQRKPFLDSINVTGTSKHLDAFNKVISQAKLGALESKMIDPAFAPTAGIAMKKFMAGNFGELSGLYKNLDQASKDTLRDKMIKGFSDRQQAMDLDERAKTIADGQAARTLGLTLLDPNLPQAEREKTAKKLYALKAVSLTEAQTLMSPLEGADNAVLYAGLIDQVNRGSLSSIGDATNYKGQLSRQQFSSLLAHMNSEQGKQATKLIQLEAGIRQNAFITEDQKAKEKLLLNFYTEELGKRVKNADGVDVLQTPVDAAKAAINAFGKDKVIQQSLSEQKAAQAAIEKVFEQKGMKMPNLPIDQIDFDNPSYSKFSDGERSRMKQQKDKYIRSIQK
jgi:hypothetical protein